MNLTKMIGRMRSDALRACYEPEFQAVRAQHEELARFPDLASFVAALPLDRGETLEAKHAITWLLIRAYAERQAKSLWSSLLVIAYEPLLAATCRIALSLPEDERVQTILSAFLEAVRTAAGHAYVRSAPGFLAFYTRMAVVHGFSVEAERGRAAELVPYDEDQTLTNPRDVFDPPGERVQLAAEILDRALRSRSERPGPTAQPKAGDPGVSLTDIVRVFASDQDPKERRRLYKRIWWHARQRVRPRKPRATRSPSPRGNKPPRGESTS